MGKGTRGYVFTAWDVETITKAETLKGFKYLVVAPEVCPTTNRKHIQGYVYFLENKTHSAAVKALEVVFKVNTPVNVDIANGDAQDNKTYIVGPYTKDDKHKPFNPDAKEYGEIPQQGKRNDLANVRDLIKNGKGMRVIAESASNYQCIKAAEVLFKYIERKRDFKPRVIWVCGRSGSGKTRLAYDKHKHDKIHIQNAASKWWQGYDAHSVVIIDEVDENTDYNVLKQLCDRYPCVVECKGGSRQFLAKTIYITSLSRPEDLFYSRPENGKEMLRRIDEIIHLG